MFEGFVDEPVTLGAVTLQVRHALRADAPAVMLLHGHPRTSATWHRVAPRLHAAGFGVVCPDLRGYGRSPGPATDAQHSPYSKRAMADDLAALADHLGLEQLHVVGHDRGAYVALRLALDRPDRVVSLTVADAVPICEALDRVDARFATWWWHWFFFAQPDRPERAILADPDAWYGAGPDLERHMGSAAYAEYRAATHDPATVAAMLEDYRAGLGVDAEHERADRARGRVVRCPVLLLWARHDDLADLYGDPLAVWSPWAPDLRGHDLDSGHHLAEDNPHELTRALLDFLPRPGGRHHARPAPSSVGERAVRTHPAPAEPAGQDGRMSDPTPRPLSERRAAAAERLHSPGNMWLATASDGHGPHLIPVSYWWDGARLTTATFENSRTVRNIAAQPDVRASIGSTTDVLMIDAAAAVVAGSDIDDTAADGYLQSARLDPRSLPGFVYLQLTPQRMQLWNGREEFTGRTIMRGGQWLDDPVD